MMENSQTSFPSWEGLRWCDDSHSCVIIYHSCITGASRPEQGGWVRSMIVNQ